MLEDDKRKRSGEVRSARRGSRSVRR